MKKEENPQFNNSKSFSIYIETFANKNKIPHIDAIVEYCKENFIDLEDISKLISPSLKEKLKLEYEELNYLKKTTGFKI